MGHHQASMGGFTAAVTATLLVCALASEGATAQQRQPTAALEEIVVTARKREEDLQTVPLSITVVTETELLRSGATSLDNVAEMTPGLAFNDVNGAFQSPVIRGLAQTDQLSLEGNVGVFVDGVYLDNRSGLEFGMIELERIEVVKGPQSALYGRNTFAGAINYVTKEPTTEGWDGIVEASGGSDDMWSARGSINIPIGDMVAIRAFGGDSAFGGTIRNVRNGSNLGGYRERSTYGAQILFEPTERFRAKVFAVRNTREDEQPAYRVYPPSNNNCGPVFNVAPMGQPVQPVFGLYCGDAPVASDVTMDPRGKGVEGQVDLIYGNLSYDFGPFSITALVSRAESEYSTFIDGAADPTAFQRTLAPGFSQQLFTDSASDEGESDSYEVRIESPDDSAVRWMFGGSYFDTRGGTILASTATPIGQLSPLAPVARVVRTLESQETALFGSVGVNIGERLRVNAEVRYAEIDQDFSGFTALLFLPIPPIVVPANSQELSAWTPRVTLDYQLNDDVLLYASGARGWKAGGFNTAVAPFQTFEPETNWTYEVGAKSTLLDGRLQLNGAVYFIDWEDIQIPATTDVFGNTAIVNLEGATSQGIEVEASWLVTADLSVRIGATYLEPEFKSGVQDGSLFSICGLRPDSGIVSAPCSIDVGGNQIPKVPDTQLFVGGTYTFREVISNYDAYFRADFSHQSEKFVNSLNTASAGEINLLNLRLGVGNGRTEVALWVDNALDEEWIRSLQSILDPGVNTPCVSRGQNCSAQLLRVYPGDQRTYGLTATFRF